MVLLYPEIKFTEYSFCHTPEGHAYTDLNSCLCLKQRGVDRHSLHGAQRDKANRILTTESRSGRRGSSC